MTEKFLTNLQNSGWRIALRGGQAPAVPAEVWERYGSALKPWLALLGGVKSAVNREETVWLLCAEDYAAKEDAAFPWDAWERLSLESAAGDQVWESEIRRFWDRHLPIILSVENGYAYYAISTEDGAVVSGMEPEFEECETAAASLEEFLENIQSGSLRL